jgi:two-component system LytT family sensor kinase
LINETKNRLMDKRKNHIIFWVGYLGLIDTFSIILMMYRSNLNSFFYIRLIEKDVLIIALTYFYYYVVFPFFLFPNGYIFIVLIGIISYFFASVIIYGIDISIQVLCPNIIPSLSFLTTLLWMLTPFFRIINLSFSFWFLRKLLFQLRQKKEKEALFFILNKNTLSAELLSLKNQINPHFFYNSLNFLYAQALPYSNKLSKSILTLSDMMRFSIGDSIRANTIPLEQEITYLENYLYLENIENAGLYNSQLTVKGNVRYRRITPMIFQPLINKAFLFGSNVVFEIRIEEAQILFIITYIKKDNVLINDINNHIDILKEKMIGRYYQELRFNYNPISNICNTDIVLLT